MIDIQIKGSQNQTVQVTPNGGLCVQLGQHNLIERRLILDSNAVNFYKPRPFERFIVDGIIVNTDRNVGVNGALITTRATTTTT